MSESLVAGEVSAPVRPSTPAQGGFRDYFLALAAFGATAAVREAFGVELSQAESAFVAASAVGILTAGRKVIVPPVRAIFRRILSR